MGQSGDRILSSHLTIPFKPVQVGHSPVVHYIRCYTNVTVLYAVGRSFIFWPRREKT